MLRGVFYFVLRVNPTAQRRFSRAKQSAKRASDETYTIGVSVNYLKDLAASQHKAAIGEKMANNSSESKAIRVFLVAARHMVLQGYQCYHERKCVIVHPEDTRIRDPIGSLIRVSTIAANPKLVGYVGTYTDHFIVKVLTDNGVDMSDYLVMRTLHQLVSIHDKFSPLRWPIVLPERFQMLFPSVPLTTEMLAYIRGDAHGPAGLDLTQPPAETVPSLSRVEAIHAELNKLEGVTEAAGSRFDYALKSAYEDLGRQVFERFVSSNQCSVDTVILKQSHLQDQLDNISNLSGKALTTK